MSQTEPHIRRSIRGDVMEDYRALTIRVCPVCGEPTTKPATCRGTHDALHAPAVGEDREYVPASALEGAVDALRRLETLADEYDAGGHPHTAALIRERIEGPSTTSPGGR